MKNKKNKGFTLVELIIVVAIIAVLAAVLAPQYLRYVERSRQSNDLQVATSIMRASQAAVADPRNSVPATGVLTVTWVTSGTATDLTVAGGAAPANVDATAIARIEQDIAEVMGWWSGTAIADVSDAESSAGNGVNFQYRLEVATGNITILDGAGNVPAASAAVPWVDEIGVDD